MLTFLNLADFLPIKHKCIETFAHINPFLVPEICPLELIPSC